MSRPTKRINPVGKKIKAWNKARREIKHEFENLNITTCEVCGTDNNLSFAHRVKRRFITDEKELKTVALLCIFHHEQIENAGHEIMFNRINEIIEKREFQFA